MFFLYFFRLNSTGKKVLGKKHRKFHGTWIFDATQLMKKKIQKFDLNLKTPQAVVSHQSTQSTRRSAKTWELGQ